MRNTFENHTVTVSATEYHQYLERKIKALQDTRTEIDAMSTTVDMSIMIRRQRLSDIDTELARAREILDRVASSDSNVGPYTLSVHEFYLL